MTADRDSLFWARVQKTETCWLWTGSENGRGYGKLGNTYAHRLSYEMHRGPIPFGLTIDHLCRVRNCVNPDHLEAVTLRENLMRSENFSAVHARKTHCPQGHPYDETNTYRDRGNMRHCRICRRIQQTTWYDANRRSGKLNALKTHCPQGHPYEGTNLYITKTGGRACRTCRRESLQRFHERSRNANR